MSRFIYFCIWMYNHFSTIFVKILFSPMNCLCSFSKAHYPNIFLCPYCFSCMFRFIALCVYYFIPHYLNYFHALLLGTYIFSIIMSSWDLPLLSLCNEPLYPWYLALLWSLLCLKLTYLCYILLALALYIFLHQFYV